MGMKTCRAQTHVHAETAYSLRIQKNKVEWWGGGGGGRENKEKKKKKNNKKQTIIHEEVGEKKKERNHIKRRVTGAQSEQIESLRTGRSSRFS